MKDPGGVAWFGFPCGYTLPVLRLAIRPFGSLSFMGVLRGRL